MDYDGNEMIIPRTHQKSEPLEYPTILDTDPSPYASNSNEKYGVNRKRKTDTIRHIPHYLSLPWSPQNSQSQEKYPIQKTVLDDQFTSNCQTVCEKHVIKSFEHFKNDFQNDLKQDWIIKKTDNLKSLCDISCPDSGFPPWSRMESVIQVDKILKVNIFCSKSGHLLQEPSFVFNKLHQFWKARVLFL